MCEQAYIFLDRDAFGQRTGVSISIYSQDGNQTYTNGLLETQPYSYLDTYIEAAIDVLQNIQSKELTIFLNDESIYFRITSSEFDDDLDFDVCKDKVADYLYYHSDVNIHYRLVSSFENDRIRSAKQRLYNILENPTGPRYYDGCKKEVNPSCMETIDRFREQVIVSDKELINLKTDGSDGWSFVPIAEIKNLLYETDIEVIERRLLKTQEREFAFKWFVRGLSLENAIKKAQFDYMNQRGQLDYNLYR